MLLHYPSTAAPSVGFQGVVSVLRFGVSGLKGFGFNVQGLLSCYAVRNQKAKVFAECSGIS